MIELGITARDKITGFTGIVTGVVEYISGCNQALIVPKTNKDGSLICAEWFDLQRLERVGKTKIALDNGETPGCDKMAPKR